MQFGSKYSSVYNDRTIQKGVKVYVCVCVTPTPSIFDKKWHLGKIGQAPTITNTHCKLQ